MAIQDELFKEIIDWSKDPLNKPKNQNKYLYGDGVTYYQELCKILKYVKYLKDYLEEKVVSKEYVDEEILKVKQEVQEKLNVLEQQLSTQIQAVEDDVQGVRVEIGTINQEITDILQQLENKLESTDYASETTGGTLKQNSETAFLVDEDGKPYVQTKTYIGYGNASDNLFVGKGTLEHVLDKETIRTDKQQSLDEAHQTQARNNINAQEKLTAGTNITIENGIISASGEIGADWNDVSNKPLINNHELASGNNTLDSLGIQPKGDYLVEDDLSDYVKNSDYATSSKGGAIKTGSYFDLSSSGQTICGVQSYESYLSGSANRFVSNGTLGNVIAGKGLVSDTDYATTDKGGVIKTGSYLEVQTDGSVRCGVMNSSAYSSGGNNRFISKGTLENIKNDLVKRALVDNNITLTDEEKLAIETWLGLSENYLTYYNATPYQVTTDYNPAHKKYVNDNFQSKLVSGTNIKTINNISILGSGNIAVSSAYGINFSNILGSISGGSDNSITATSNGVALIKIQGYSGDFPARFYIDGVQCLISYGTEYYFALPVSNGTTLRYTQWSNAQRCNITLYGTK